MPAKKNNTILIVEDDPMLLDLYVDILTSANYAVDTAINGEEGLEKASIGGYSLILLDILLPKKDGLSVLQALKENPPKNKNGPIVVLTNLNQEKIIREGLSLGASCCLLKSMLTPNEILREVNRFLDGKQTAL